MAVSVLFKSCPHCKNGDLVFQKDIEGAYWQCCQCGYLKDLIGGDTELARFEPRPTKGNTRIPSDYRKPRLPTSGSDRYPNRTIGVKP